MPGQGPIEVENSTQLAPQQWFLEWGGWSANGEVVVNGWSALTHCPLWQGVNIIAGDVGQVGVRLVRNEFDEQKRHPAWNLLRVRPNALQTPSVFKETLMQWALVWGNAVALIVRRGSRPVELIPLRPDCVWPELVEFDGQQVLVYHYTSQTTGRYYKFLPDDVLHIQGLTVDGIWGWPLSIVAKTTIQHGLSLQKHGTGVFANGAVPGGVLEAPPEATGLSKDPDARRNLRNEWNELHRGPDKAGTVAILWEGIKYRETSRSNVDAQWIEAKKLGVYEAAALLSLPPHKLGAMQDSSVRANLEEQNQDYAQRTLTRWFNRLDEEYRRKLLTYEEWQSDEFRFKHDVDAFLRGDIDTLTTVGDRCVKAEIMNRNEARRMIGLAPYQGGEKFGSPAINPQPRPAGGAEKPDNEPAEPENRWRRVRRAHRALLVDRVAHVLECEASRVVHAAASAKNFVRWLDEFYIDDDGGRFAAVATGALKSAIRASRSVGIDAGGVLGALRSHGLAQHAALLVCATESTREALCAAVAELLEKQKPSQTARAICRGELARKPTRRAA